MKEIKEFLIPTEVKSLCENPFTLLSNDWMLITAKDGEKYNTMTASWGGFGVLWSKNVASIYVRPQRYTYEFIENSEYFTLSVLPAEYRNALNFCGSKSGRDYDKAKECGITPVIADESVAFGEARLVLVCKKLYYTDIDPKNFYDAKIDSVEYKNHDYHRMYIAEIISAYKK